MKLLVLLLLSFYFSHGSFAAAASGSLKQCSYCHNENPPMRCKNCHALYCNATCQQKHWPQHKPSCQFSAYYARLKEEAKNHTMLQKINPRYHEDEAFRKNCDNAALVYDYYLKTGNLPEGFQDGAKPFHGEDQMAYFLTNITLGLEIGFDMSLSAVRKFTTIQEMNNELRNKPDGSRFYVKGYLPVGSYFIPDSWTAFIVDGKLYHLKPQIGRELNERDFLWFMSFAYYQTY